MNSNALSFQQNKLSNEPFNIYLDSCSLFNLHFFFSFTPIWIHVHVSTFTFSFPSHVFCFLRQLSLFMGSIATLFKKNIKNGFHSTIYTFKNYFVSVFSVFSKNKLYPNISLVWLCFYVGLVHYSWDP